MLSKAKQSKAKPVLYLLNYFKFLFQKYFFYLVKSFLTLIKFNFDSLSRKIKINAYMYSYVVELSEGEKRQIKDITHFLNELLR